MECGLFVVYERTENGRDKNMWILMICNGAAAGIIGMILARKLITARGALPEKGLVTGEYAPLFWGTLGSAGFGLIHLLDATMIQKAEYITIFMICICISAVDFTIRKIPNSLVLALIATRILFMALQFSTDEVVKSLWGLGTACIIFLLPSLLRIKVGAGDIKLAAVTGFYLGVNGFLQAMIIMAVTISAYGVYIMIRRMGSFKSKTAMGPYLALGMFCTLLFPIL